MRSSREPLYLVRVDRLDVMSQPPTFNRMISRNDSEELEAVVVGVGVGVVVGVGVGVVVGVIVGVIVGVVDIFGGIDGC